MNKPCVVFETSGLIPLEAFMTFGVNVKPNSTNPFGYFGTGLKYAIAICLRNKCEVILWRGRTQYKFYAKQEAFRGTDFDFIRMRRIAWTGKATYTKLPFTTELGKNWELWQAFRELETNTCDENGRTFTLGGNDDFVPLLGGTTICVYGSRFIDEFHEMGRHFLPEGKTVREDEGIQVIARPSKHIYYRGVRIMDLKEEARFTYNFLRHVDLTEDRTAKLPFMLDAHLAEFWATHDDERLVQRAVMAPRGSYESNLNYGYVSGSVSTAFGHHAARSPNPTARELWDQKQPTVPSTTTITLTIPRPEVTPNEMVDICRVVAEVLGIEDVKAKNMQNDEEVLF